MAPQFQDQMCAAKIHPYMGVSRFSFCKGLPRGKGFATHRRVHSIESAKAMDTCNAARQPNILVQAAPIPAAPIPPLPSTSSYASLASCAYPELL
jgi:hypothetical protein